MKKIPLKIAIIDNDENLKSVYQIYFEHTEEYELCGVYPSVTALLSEFGGLHPDIIISEVSLPGVNGMDGIAHFKKKNSSVKLLMMSNRARFETIKEAFKKGACGYLTKPLSKERLFNALEELEMHGITMEHEVAKKIISSFQTKSFDSFSRKENEIIELLTQGFTYKMIADRLCVTTSAVNFHIQNIYVKLNVNSKSEALQKIRELETRRLNAA